MSSFFCKWQEGDGKVPRAGRAAAPLPEKGPPSHRNEICLRNRRLRGLHSDGLNVQPRHQEDSTFPSQLLPAALMLLARGGRNHGRRCGHNTDQASPHPAKARKLSWLPVWFLHSWNGDVYVRLIKKSDGTQHGANSSVSGWEFVPLHRIQTYP